MTPVGGLERALVWIALFRKVLSLRLDSNFSETQKHGSTSYRPMVISTYSHRLFPLFTACEKSFRLSWATRLLLDFHWDLNLMLKVSFRFLKWIIAFKILVRTSCTTNAKSWCLNSWFANRSEWRTSLGIGIAITMCHQCCGHDGILQDEHLFTTWNLCRTFCVGWMSERLIGSDLYCRLPVHQRIHQLWCTMAAVAHGGSLAPRFRIIIIYPVKDISVGINYNFQFGKAFCWPKKPEMLKR